MISRPITYVLVLSVAGLLALAGCGDDSDDSEASEPETQAAPAPAQPTSASITAAKAEPVASWPNTGNLGSAYVRDKAGTDARYKGKLLELTGAVSSFGTNKENVAFVNLDAILQCVFAEPGPQEVFSSLTVGQLSTVRGIYEGDTDSVKDMDEEGQAASVAPLDERLTLSDCQVVG